MIALRILNDLRKSEKNNSIFNPLGNNIVPALNKAIKEIKLMKKLLKAITEMYCDSVDDADDDADIQYAKTLLGIE